MRRTPHSIKKDPKIWDMSTGTLKEGYTFHPVNEGYEQVSSIKTQKRTGAGKDGTNWEITGAKPIYKDGPSPKTAPAAPVMPEAAPEPIPQPVPEAPAVPSQQQQQAQDLVNDYTSSIIQNSGISSQIYASPADAFYEKPATSFLNAKKIQFGKGLNLQ